MWKGPSVHAARNVFADQDTQHMSQGSDELHTYMPRNLEIAVERSYYLLPFIVCLYPDIVLFMEYPTDFNNLCFSRQGKDASLFSFAAVIRGKDVHAPLASRNGPFMDVGWFSHRVRPIMEISQQKVCSKSPILDVVNHAPLVIVSFPHMEMLLFKSSPTNPHVILLIFNASKDSFLGPMDIALQPSRFSQGPTVSAMHSMVHVFSTSRPLLRHDHAWPFFPCKATEKRRQKKLHMSESTSRPLTCWLFMMKSFVFCFFMCNIPLKGCAPLSCFSLTPNRMYYLIPRL